jgi:hypothetical protein
MGTPRFNRLLAGLRDRAARPLSSPRDGVLYVVADSLQVLAECAHSARSLKRHCPDLPVQLITNIPPRHVDRGLFDFSDPLSATLHPHKAKVSCLTDTRFERTLFLDADTEVRSPIHELFELLNNYDVGLTFDNLCAWESYPFRFIEQQGPYFNTGFLLFRRREQVFRHLRAWLEVFKEQDDAEISPGHLADQHYFNTYVAPELHADPDLRVLYLPNTIYNVRPWCVDSLAAAGRLRHVRIYHDHGLHLGFMRRVARALRIRLGTGSNR